MQTMPDAWALSSRDRSMALRTSLGTMGEIGQNSQRSTGKCLFCLHVTAQFLMDLSQDSLHISMAQYVPLHVDNGEATDVMHKKSDSVGHSSQPRTLETESIIGQLSPYDDLPAPLTELKQGDIEPPERDLRDAYSEKAIIMNHDDVETSKLSPQQVKTEPKPTTTNMESFALSSPAMILEVDDIETESSTSMLPIPRAPRLTESASSSSPRYVLQSRIQPDTGWTICMV